MKMMNMGRLMAWALVVAMPLWFGSCKKENGVIDPIVTPNAIEGSWKISSIKGVNDKGSVDYFDVLKELGGQDVVTCLTETKITFAGNGNVTGTPSPICQSGGSDTYNPAKDKATWKVAGNKVSITDSDGTESYDLTISGNTMTWSIQQQDDLDEDGVKETYTQTIEFKRA